MTVKDRYQGLQTLFQVAHDSSCHFLVLCTIIEEKNRETNPDYKLDLIEAIRLSMSKGYMKETFFVHDALEILKLFTGHKWSRRTEPTLPDLKPNEWSECNWFNPNTGLEHFTRRNINTLSDSRTVREGYIRYYYIYTCED